MMRQRIARLRTVLRNRRLDALIVSSLPHIRYLCGFSGSHALLIIGRTAATLITDSRYRAQSALEVRGVRRAIARGSLQQEAADRRLLSRCRRVGVESFALSLAEFRNLRSLFRGISFVHVDAIVSDLASVKSTDEVRWIRNAASITDEVFAGIISRIRPGVAERDIAAEISYQQKLRGAEGDAFEPIVAGGERGALPHARPTARRFRRGDLVILDFGCVVNGYHSDLTRTIAVGPVSRTRKEMYEAVLKAQEVALGSARGGMEARELDAIARTVIAQCGFGRYFSHSLGHGLGLEIHEQPRVSSLSNDRLTAGNVITIEPGIYINGEGGVRIEDDVVLTDTGCEVLTRASKNLMVG
jgi:Xaa-Pro aminopeptidase